MKLCIDVGNTTVVYGFFKENELVSSFSYYTHSYHTLDEINSALKTQLQQHDINPNEVDAILYCSVAPSIDSYMFNVIDGIFNVKPIVLKPGVKTGLPINIDNPSEVGADIIGDCAIGKERYGYPLLIVDLGTASKVLLIDEKGAFSAAVIIPGVDISRMALSSKAALLPEVGFKEAAPVLKCKNTIDAMNTGLILSHVYGIKGIVEEYKKALGKDVKVILTGGAAVHLKDYLTEYIYEPHLLLEGLNLILNKNR